MSMTVQLPPTLQERLAHVARRVRLLRALRGLSLLVLALALVGGTALLLDSALGMNLPAGVRILAFALWAGIGMTIGVVGLLLPLLRPLDPADLAALIEEKYPELGERLTSSVELCQNSDLGNGSPELVALLVRETEARVRPLDFLSPLHGRSPRLLATLAAATVLLTLVPAAFYPQEYVHLTRRFLLPWASTAPLPDFRFAIEPGDTFAARGRPLTIAAELTPRNDRIALPEVATLLVTEYRPAHRGSGADGSETRHDLHPDGDHPTRFAIPFRVKGDFTYRIQAGNATSAAYQVTAVTPVELAAGSPGIVVTPPTYARSSIDTETLTGLIDLTALKHSDVAFHFQFTRPAVSAVLDWLPGEGEAKGKPVKHTLTLSDDRKSTRLALTALETGTYRLVLEAEHGVRTELDGGTITVKPDQPPSVLRFAGKEDLRAARPHDRVPVELRIADDIAVAGAELLWKVNDGKETSEPIRLDGAGTREALARHTFLLAGKAKEGDEVRYRIRYQDNLPKEFGGPHTLYYPTDRWLALKIVKQVGSLKEQEVKAQRDAIDRKLEQIITDLKQLKRASDRVRAESRGNEALSEDQAEQVRQLRRQNQGNQKALRDLATEVEEMAALAKLADAAREVAGQELRKTDDALRDTTDRETQPGRREQRFRDADRELDRALARLGELQKLNDKLTRERLDQAKVETLADRQRELAEKAAELAAKGPEAKEQLAQLQREQKQVADELKRLTENSEALKKALEDARAEKARQAADRARELAEAQRDLARASAETEQRREGERLAQLVKRQQELADKAAELAKETAQPARATPSGQPLKPDEARKASESLQKGDAERAAQEQARSARELERLANELEKAANLARDPREAAKQLARLEEDLARRTRLEGARKPADRPLGERLEAMKKEQEAVRRSAEALSVPPTKADAQADKKRALEQLAAAEQALQEEKANEAAARMEKARDALRNLADKLPTAAERRQQAQRELEQIRRDQDAVARKAEAAAQQKDGARQRAEAAKQQAALADRLRKLDTPNQEARRDRTRRALDAALKDLLDGNKEKTAASQTAAKRELERLAQALAGQKPADEWAAELARRQEELARQAEKAAGDRSTPKEKLAELAGQQRKLADEVKGLDAKEAPAIRKQAADAARKAAEETAKSNPTGQEARAAMQESAQKLAELARAMRGEEADRKEASKASPREQAAELARQQQKLAALSRQAQRAAEENPGEASRKALEQAMRQAAKQQRSLNEQAAKLPAGGDPKALEQARSAMNQAQEALEGNDAARAQRRQQEAARALERLAQSQPQQPQRQDRAEEGQQALPNQLQAQRARDLAREQRELQDAARQAGEQARADRRADSAPDRENPAGKLAEAQRQISREASRLTEQVGREQGARSAATQQADEASRAAQQAARSLQAGALEQARSSGEQTARQMQQLAKQLTQTPRGEAEPGSKDPLQQARDLARRQEQLNREMEPLASDPQAQRAQQQARQAELAREAGEVQRQLQQMGQSPSLSPEAQKSAREAGNQAGQAEQQMRQAQKQGQQGNQPGAQQSREQAAQALERAAQQARQAAGQTPGEQGQPTPSAQAGQSVRQAQGQMQQAQGAMQKGQPNSARESMQNAAQQLQNAAQQLQRAMQPGRPNEQSEPGEKGAEGGGVVDSKSLPKELAAHAGKRWGELPGELRTKIVQEMRAKYGDDYARMIKLYFEQIADTRRSSKK